jgi:tetrahydromethanopterin S-methyltransferase subunit F
MVPREVLEEIKYRNQMNIERDKELKEIFGLRVNH